MNALAQPSNALPLDAVTLGESMVLFVAQSPGPLAQVEQFTKRLAGAETNVAIGLARLGLRVGWISRLGADSFGDYVRSAVEREGVDCSRVPTDPQRRTGFMLKTLAQNGEDPAIEYYRAGSAASAMDTANLDADYLLSARHFHATGILPALTPATYALSEHAMQSARTAGRSVSFDPNLRPRLWKDAEHMARGINHLARLAHWVLPGLAEGRQLTGYRTAPEIAAFYLDQGSDAVVVKLGAEGAYFRTRSGESGQLSGVPVAQVVDTVGAGDGFAAGLLSARLEGLPWAAAVARGNWVGAQAIQVLGDMDGLPWRHQLPPALT